MSGRKGGEGVRKESKIKKKERKREKGRQAVSSLIYDIIRNVEQICPHILQMDVLQTRLKIGR